jgi:hypothetical protein
MLGLKLEEVHPQHKSLVNPLETMPLAEDEFESLDGKSALCKRRFKPAFDGPVRATVNSAEQANME